MKLHSDPRTPLLTVTSCSPTKITVGSHILERSLLLMPDRIDSDWGPNHFSSLSAQHLSALSDLSIDVLLLGTGLRQRFPSPALLRPLIEAGIPVEVMDTAAACRTYNILVAEGRMVAAALILETGTGG